MRLGIEYAAAGSLTSAGGARGNRPPTALSTIASDLLLPSIGLWLARAYALVRRSREDRAVPAADETSPSSAP